MRNEQRLFIQLIAAMFGAMCQGSVFCFSLFGPTLKSPPFNFTESQVNFIASIAALCNYFALPGGLFFDHCGGSRPTLIGATIIISGCWFGLHWGVFQEAASWLAFQEQQTKNSSRATNISTTTSTIINSNYYTDTVAPHTLALITVLFSLLFTGPTWIEMSVLVNGLGAFRFHHGWFVVLAKTMIGLGSSAQSLLASAFFVTDNNLEKTDLSSKFCLFLGCYSGAITLSAALLTSSPMKDVNDNNNNKNSSIMIPSSPRNVNNNKNNTSKNDEAADETAPLFLSTKYENNKNTKPLLASIISKWWDIRVIGINCVPPPPTPLRRRLQNDTATTTTNSSPSPAAASAVPDLQTRLDYHELYKPLMQKAMWLLLFCFILVVSGSSIELGASGFLPHWAFVLIALLVVSIPIYFLSLQYWLPGLDYYQSVDEVVADAENNKKIAAIKEEKKKTKSYFYENESDKPWKVKLVEKVESWFGIVDNDNPVSRDENEDEEKNENKINVIGGNHHQSSSSSSSSFSRNDTGISNKSRRLLLLDFEDDYNELQPPNDRTLIGNLRHHPFDIFALWFMFFGLWGSTVMIYSNVYSIYYALQGEDFTFTSARNAIFVSIFGVGNAAGRALAGMCVPLLQGRARSINYLLPVAPMLNAFGLLLFLVCRGAALALPFLICGLATGCSWSTTIVFCRRTFKYSSSHYSLFYTAGSAGIVTFCIGMYSKIYEHEASKQQQQHHQNITTTTAPIDQQQGHQKQQQQPDSPRHCIGLQCIEISIWVAILVNLISVLCSQFVIRRLERGCLNSTTTMISISSIKATAETVCIRERGRESNFRFDDDEKVKEDDDNPDKDVEEDAEQQYLAITSVPKIDLSI